MVDFNDRREGRPDFADGKNAFSFRTHGDAERERWSGQPPTRASKRDVHAYYTSQKPTKTWREVNRLASRRTRRSGGDWGSEVQNTANYAKAYEENLVNVLRSRGLSLASRYGEIGPGR